MTIKYFVNIARKLEDIIWNSVEKESFVFFYFRNTKPSKI